MNPIEYKTIPEDEVARLPELWAEGWIATFVTKGKIVMYREKKKTKSERNIEWTNEYKQFLELYKPLSDNWIYDPKVKIKYNSLVKDWLHARIIESIPLYEKECRIKNRPFKNPYTFLNQRTWEQEFKITKNKEDEWMNDILKKEKIEVIEITREYVRDWKKNYPTKTFTEWVLHNMIEKARTMTVNHDIEIMYND